MAKYKTYNKLLKRTKPNPETGCLEWQGAKSKGHGRLTRNSKKIAAHRLAWELKYGEIPDGLWVLHKCDNRPCINIKHLYLGNCSDNTRDMYERNIDVMINRMVNRQLARWTHGLQ
jgi:hypothetical protein